MPVKKETEISVLEIRRSRVTFCIRGTAPLIYNAMSYKTQQQLLLPPQKKNAAERASTLKHEPLREFRDSTYVARDPESPTYLVCKSTMFKAAMMGAARDIPGVARTSIGRLCYVVGDEVPIYGIPEIFMAVTRSADMNRTPDVRTRAVIPHWAAIVTVEFTTPILKEDAIANLFAAAGITHGIGDWRQEKGSGNYGSYEVVSHDELQEIMETGGKDAQISAMENPDPFDSETEELLTWYETEVKRRGFKQVS